MIHGRQARRLGWKFPWVSAKGNRFAYDFGFSFDPGASGEYNFRHLEKPNADLPGFTMFAKGPDGAIYQTYNIQGRGQDIINAAYNLLDFTAKGRDEDGLPHTMSWVRYHDEYAAG